MDMQDYLQKKNKEQEKINRQAHDYYWQLQNAPLYHKGMNGEMVKQVPVNPFGKWQGAVGSPGKVDPWGSLSEEVTGLGLNAKRDELLRRLQGGM